MIPLDQDQNDINFKEFLDKGIQDKHGSKTEQVLQNTQQKYDQILGKDVKLVALDKDQAERYLAQNKSGKTKKKITTQNSSQITKISPKVFEKTKNGMIMEDSTETSPQSYEVLGEYDQVMLCIDASFSMGGDIARIAEHVKKVVESQEELPEEQKTRFGLWAYTYDYMKGIGYLEEVDPVKTDTVVSALNHMEERNNAKSGKVNRVKVIDKDSTMDHFMWAVITSVFDNQDSSKKRLVRLYTDNGLDGIDDDRLRRLKKWTDTVPCLDVQFVVINSSWGREGCIFSLEDLLEYWNKTKDKEGLEVNSWYEKNPFNKYDESGNKILGRTIKTELNPKKPRIINSPRVAPRKKIPSQKIEDPGNRSRG